MKKVLLFLMAIALPLAILAQSATPIGRHANLSIFSGYFAKQQNTNNNGYWIGAYGDLPIFRSANEKWNFGVYGLYVHSKWTDNMAPYTTNSNDFAAGLNGGYYNEFFSESYSFYGGLALGYKNSQEIGRVKTKKYSSEGKQQDHMLVANLNLNLMKVSGYNPRFAPRSQLIFSLQRTFDAKKWLSENGADSKPATPWNKDFYETSFKQSLVDISLNYSQSAFLQPKIGIQYSHYLAGNPDAYAWIGELAFHKASADDFLSIGVMQKYYSTNNTRDWFFMISLNIMNIARQ